MVSRLRSLPRLSIAISAAIVWQDFSLSFPPLLPPPCISQFRSAHEIVPGAMLGTVDLELMQSQELPGLEETFKNCFSSVAQLCLTLCDPMNRSTPGLRVHH